ncbi:hypothetical protein ACFYKX_10420 [Cytobacillus sp. FJAT-54145]|uniref:Secreted protein n=1 Tax=Cytobacillus spartinae TaxID=3299023 RepID=A0ABW6K9Y8_9BACI
MAGFAGATSAAQTVTYSVEIQEPSLDLVVTGNTALQTYQKIDGVIVADTVVNIKNNGSVDGRLYAQVGDVSASGLTYSTTIPDAASEVLTSVSDAVATTLLDQTLKNTNFEVLAGGNENFDLEILFGANTPTGTYNIPVTWTLLAK